MKKQKESFFWTSYSDLMTSLFFIMLVLFVLVIVLLHKRMEVTEQQLEDIENVVNSTKDLNREYFTYRPEYKKYVLNIKVEYPVGLSSIKNIDDKTKDELYAAGVEIRNFLLRHHDAQYILVIEGQASNLRDGFSANYPLSYDRAYGLFKYWTEDRHLDFGGNCEIQISGSGDGTLDTRSMREADEKKNQRFLIQILPKNVIQDEKN